VSGVAYPSTERKLYESGMRVCLGAYPDGSGCGEFYWCAASAGLGATLGNKGIDAI